MPKRIVSFIAPLMLLPIAIAPASAQQDICYDLTVKGIKSPAEIEPCTREINSGRLRGPELARAYINRGVLHETHRNYDSAFADYDNAVRTNPKNAYAYVNRGDMYERKGDRTRAFEDFATAIKLEPNNADNWNVRCWALVRSNVDIRQALSDCNKALELKPRDAAFLKNRGFVHVRLGNYDRAIADLDAAIENRQRFAAGFYLRGIAKLRKGDGSGKDDIARAAEISPGIVEEYESYGVKR